MENMDVLTAVFDGNNLIDNSERRLPEWEPPCDRRVRSIIIAVEVDACDVFGAVGEAVERDLQCCGARRSEDVG